MGCLGCARAMQGVRLDVAGFWINAIELNGPIDKNMHVFVLVAHPRAIESDQRRSGPIMIHDQMISQINGNMIRP